MMNGTVADRGKFLFVFRNVGSWKIEYTELEQRSPAAMNADF